MSVQGALKNTGTIEVLSTGDQVYFSVEDSETLTLTGIGKVVMGDGTDNGYNNLPVFGGFFSSSGALVNESTIEGTGDSLWHKASPTRASLTTMCPSAPRPRSRLQRNQGSSVLKPGNH